MVPRPLLSVLLLLSLAPLCAAQKQIPLPRTSPTSGPQMYRAYCADCHGQDAKGNGPLTAVLKIAPPDLTSLAQRNKGQFPYERVQRTIRGESKIAAHGSREMPMWGPVFRSMAKGNKGEAQVRIKTLTRYIESLQGK